jgi:hypothetical protein
VSSVRPLYWGEWDAIFSLTKFYPKICNILDLKINQNFYYENDIDKIKKFW